MYVINEITVETLKDRETEGDNIKGLKESEGVKNVPSTEGIRFSKFTSCIGIISKKHDLLNGVHLCIYSNGTKISGADIPNIKAIIGDDHDDAFIFGMVSVWEGSGLRGFLDTLKTELSISEDKEYPWGDGRYIIRYTDGFFYSENIIW